MGLSLCLIVAKQQTNASYVTDDTSNHPTHSTHRISQTAIAMDAAFEAFATCDFASASQLALAELRQSQQSSRLEETPLSPSRRVGGVPLPALPGASKATVALTEACSRCVHCHQSDRIVGIAQSARPSHPPPRTRYGWIPTQGGQAGGGGAAVRAGAAAGGGGPGRRRVLHPGQPRPHALPRGHDLVRFLSSSADYQLSVVCPSHLADDNRLQILLSQGTQARFEEAKQTLLALRQAMEASGLPRRAEEEAEQEEQEEEEDGATTEGSGATAEESETPPITAEAIASTAVVSATGNGGVEAAAIRRMYAQATELLVLRVLLPQGEGPRAMALLQQEQERVDEEGVMDVSLLEAGHRQRLLEACRSDARRRAARGSIAGGGVGGSSSSKSGGTKRRIVGPPTSTTTASTAAAGYGREQHQQLPSRRLSPLPAAQYAISRERLTPSAIAAARARSPSSSWASSLGSWLGGGQQGRYGRARRLLLAVVGFCVLALGFHARRGGRSDGPFRLIRAALAAVLKAAGAGTGRAALGSSA